MVKKMIERYCPRLQISKVCSLRDCSHEDLHANIIISTAKNDILPSHTIIVDSFFTAKQWHSIEEKICCRTQGGHVQ